MTPTNRALPAGIERKSNTLATDDAIGVTLPVGFRATSSDDGFTLVITSRPVWAWFLGVFSLFWNGFLIVWFTVTLSDGMWWLAAFASIHAVMGISIAYLALRGLLNRIEISVSRGVLTLRHRPLPWFSFGPMTRAEIEQLFVVVDRSLKVNNVPVERYSLRVRDRRGKARRLVLVDSVEQAQYLEREIERAFHLEDERVAGELPKA